MSSYGKCFTCGADVISRTRGGLNAKDTCANGHVHPSGLTASVALAAELTRLRAQVAAADRLAEVERMREQIRDLSEAARLAHPTMQRMRAAENRERARAEAAEVEVARLRQALEFYADLSVEGPWHLPGEDYGKRARAALKGETP